MAPQNNKQETLPSHWNRATINNNNWKKMETARAYTKTTSSLSSKESYDTPLISPVSLQNIHTKAMNRKLWQKVVSQVVNSAYYL